MSNGRRIIADLLAADGPAAQILAKGWVRTRRDSKEFSFLELNDGSCLQNIQAIVDSDTDGYEQIAAASTGAAVAVRGALVASPGKGQQWEIQAKELTIIGACPDDYPMQKKRHGDEYLRTIAHLRARTNKYGAMFRLRSHLSHAVHRFFEERKFHLIHTPILTGSDTEGAGEMFQVTTLPLGELAERSGKINYGDDFFGKPAMLTVSGQLPVETYCLALGNVYTFGPTFRSENSNTSRHMAEFWMIEPEMAFADLHDDMNLAEELVKYLVSFALTECGSDLGLFAHFVDKQLLARLENIATSSYQRLAYSEAVEILQSSRQDFEFPIVWGKDLQSEHERYLTEQHFKTPVIIYDYPIDIKAFYMRQNDDGRTVAAMDLLVPGIGELIGGSQREERYDQLLARMQTLKLSPEEYWWYLETRRFGTVPHAGFGLGFERLLMLITGVNNIRDVIAFPRTPKNLEF
jgi:asparaginyl-tRNA synthetase